jgi:hypothetical protein
VERWVVGCSNFWVPCSPEVKSQAGKEGMEISTGGNGSEEVYELAVVLNFDVEVKNYHQKELCLFRLRLLYHVCGVNKARFEATLTL